MDRFGDPEKELPVKKLAREAAESTGGMPQLLFMKPRDVEELVAGLAANMERLEAISRERDERLHALLRQFEAENAALQREIATLRETQQQEIAAAVDKIVSDLTSPERTDVERFRYATLKGRLDKVVEMLENETEPEPRPWWKFWAR